MISILNRIIHSITLLSIFYSFKFFLNFSRKKKVGYMYLHRQRFSEDNFVDRTLNSQVVTDTMEKLGFQSLKQERPGLKLKKEGAMPHHPVVFIPGIVSTSLEVWQGKPCATK